MKTFAVALGLVMAATAWGCGSSGTTNPGATDDATLQDVAVDNAPVDNAGIDPTPTDVEDVTDPGPADTPLDIQFPDLVGDTTPPEVASTEPKNEATGVKIPFTVKVKFSEDIRFKETVDKNNFKVVDMNGRQLTGTYAYDQPTFTVTWTPAATEVMNLASPYTVTLTNIIQDKAGNKMKDYYVFSFSTELPPSLDGYAALAAKYSPIIYQATDAAKPQFDYITSYDFDGTWNSQKKVDAIFKAKEVPSWAYYDVIESKTHWFIRYAFYHPYNPGTQAGKDAFGNDVSGSIVVVEKRPVERPVAVLTYFGAGDLEDIRAYVTTESGIVGDKGKYYYGVNEVLDQATLFPGGHYEAYLSAKNHQSCIWAITTGFDPLDPHCRLTAGEKASMTRVKYVFVDGVKVDPIKIEADTFPATVNDVAYGLRSVLGEWWVRRDHTAEGSMFGPTYQYEAPAGRPGGGMTMPGTFPDPISPASVYKGRPPWAWKWVYASLNTNFYYYEMPRGAFFLDPAYFVGKRHRLTFGFNPQTMEGFSDAYCFNPYLLVDQRSTADCKAP